ncbi:MAG: hypothetical protein Q4D14_02280, partial [Bacteroidales bacterium]|nr:hypothetical protein [Bacteroidales bacterium]
NYFQREFFRTSPQEIIFSVKTFVHRHQKLLSACTKLKLPTRNYFRYENFRASPPEIVSKVIQLIFYWEQTKKKQQGN